MSLDLGPALRSAIVDQQNPALQALALEICEALGSYAGEPSVFAYRPVPEEAADPIVIINPDAAVDDQDGLASSRPLIMRDIAIYGRKGPPGEASDQSPAVEALGFKIRELFHRQRFSVQPKGYSITDIVAAGPAVAPVDDDGEVGRMVTLTIRLRRDP